MALPIEYDTVEIRGRYVYLNGVPAQGFVRFTGKVRALAVAAKTTILPETVTAELDANGQFAVQVPATDDPDIPPGGWTYTVREEFSNGGGSSYDIDVPLSAKATGIDLIDVAPVLPASGDPTAFVTLTAHSDLTARVVALESGGSGGGSGGISPTIVDAKGDLIVATAADLVARMPLGTNGQVLTVDTTTATGMKWAALVASNAVTSVNGRTGDVTLSKSDVGLANVDNTSDLNKPISTATQTALNAKANSTDLSSHVNNTANPHSVTKAQIGLANVDNTSDLNKPISTATQTALNGKASSTHTHQSTDVTDFAEAVDDRVASLLTAGTNVTLSYDDVTNKITVSATGGGLTAEQVLLRSPTSVQTVSLDGTFTWLRGEVPYSATDSNADQMQFYARNSADTAWIKTFWLNGNYEVRCAPSSINRVALRVFEFAEGAGGPSTATVFEVSTNPINAANREALLAVNGTGASSKPGWVVASRGISAPNLDDGDWTNLTLLNTVTAASSAYESPQARLERGGSRVALKGRIEIPANRSFDMPLFSLPAGMIPAKTRGFSVRTGGGNLATIMHIYNNGEAALQVASGANASWLYLDDISFAL